MVGFTSKNGDAVNSELYKNKRIKKFNLIAEQIEKISENYKNLSNDEILAKTNEFKNRLQSGEKMADVLVEAYALASEAIFRNFGFKPHRVQLIGALSLVEGSGIEMKTGEGKTITAILPAYFNSLLGEKVHIMTSNDYLAKRDAETVSPVFKSLGLTVGAIDSSLNTQEKKIAYSSDIIYGTTANFGFDYLRNNLAYSKEEKFEGELGFAIIDEADSLLLDQARTPLVLSDREEVSESENEKLMLAAKFVETLSDDDVGIDNDRKVAFLEESGLRKAEEFFGVEYNDLFENYLFMINNAVNAKFALEKDKDYIVKNGKIVLVDRTTARPLPSHRFTEGLHQAVEAKENVLISPESKVLGEITIQSFLKKYKRISGMSGTIKTSEEELKTIYGLDVVQIPTNKPVQRKDDTRFFCYEWEKYDAIIKDVLLTHKTGQPVLIGTTSIEESEKIRDMLEKIGIQCNILNAKNLGHEANVIANAGRLNSVTIATDMAGRGTDIKLGGDANVLAEIMAKAGYNIPLENIKKEVKINREKVIAAGGLKVIGSSLHTLVRVDGQLRGRSGRQGEIGESVFYTSLDDEIFRDKPALVNNLRNDIIKYNLTQNKRIKEKILRTIEKIQSVNESIDFLARKNMLTFDKEPSNEYGEFYKLRNQILESEDISIVFENGAQYLAEKIIDCAIEQSENQLEKDKTYYKYKNIYDKFSDGQNSFDRIRYSKREEYIEKLKTQILNSFSKKMINGSYKTDLLKSMDNAFIKHLKNVEMLKKNASVWGINDNNPVLSFETKSHEMYNDMIDNILPNFIAELAEKAPKPFSFKKFNVPVDYLKDQNQKSV